MANKVYWTTKSGVRVDIDKMSIQHLRNTLKAIVRNASKIKQRQLLTSRENFVMNGELAREQTDLHFLDECECDDYHTCQHCAHDDIDDSLKSWE